MKVFKLVAGILSIVISAIVIFQSCAAGILDALGNTGGISGGSGLIVSILMIAGGIVMIATRKSPGRGGSISAFILYLIAAVMGFAGAGIFGDLNIWAGLCAVFAVINLIAAFTVKKKQTKG